MKKFVAALVAFGITSSSFAVIKPGWERPILRAYMKEVGSTKPATNVFILTMNKKDSLRGSTKPTSFTFTTERNIMCITAPCPRPSVSTQFTIQSVTKDSCGSTVYHARENVGHTEPTILELVDHSTRLCEDYRPHRWELKLMGFRFTRNFVGNPEGVITIQ